MTYNHPEAYCLMKYRADDGTEEEIIWNSRDGVTPFIITLKSGKTATHVDWENDKRSLKHVPEPGDRVFVDLTPERAREAAERMCERYWDDPVIPINRSYPNKQAFVETHVQEYYGDGHNPDLIEVGPEGWTTDD